AYHGCRAERGAAMPVVLLHTSCCMQRAAHAATARGRMMARRRAATPVALHVPRLRPPLRGERSLLLYFRATGVASQRGCIAGFLGRTKTRATTGCKARSA